jgi:ABC-type multidrug transport system ATPase subunit
MSLVNPSTNSQGEDESKETQHFGIEMIINENDDDETNIDLMQSEELAKQQSEQMNNYFSKNEESYSPRELGDKSETVTLTWHNLTVISTQHKKILLDNVSGCITGGFWAVMGSSGGGKTTLLSTLSLRIASSSIEVEGDLRLNGAKYDRQYLKSMSGYVMQDDLLRAELTVKETLYYESQLRLPNEASEEERATRVAELLELLGISHCSDVIIGDTRRKGISGGERKRVCIAIELLMRPKLLFLDEPTR